MDERHVGLVRAVMQGREGLTRGVLLDAVHPMPLLEGAGVDPLTSRSIGTVAHLAAHAVA